MTETARWGAELVCSDQDRDAWNPQLMSPSDPYVEEVHELPYLVLRSSAFDGLALSEVLAQARELFRRLNMAMGALVDVDPAVLGDIIEFPEDGSPRRHRRLRAESGDFRLRGSSVRLVVLDQLGEVIQPPRAASQVQNWMRAAALNPGVAAAMGYLSGNPELGDLYKAFEALRDHGLAGGTISKAELTRFTRTANADAAGRHRYGLNPLPQVPMTVREARILLTTWLAAAVDEVFLP